MSTLLAGTAPGAETRGHGAPAWRTALLVLAAVLLATVWLYLPTLAHMVAQWQYRAHQVSWIVLPVAAYFVWLRVPDLRRVAPECAPAIAWLGLPCAALWLLGYAANAAIAMQLAAVGFCQIAVVAICGVRVARLLLWPLLSLWLLVPVDGGDALIAPTVRLTVRALQALGFDVLAEGNRFQVSGNPYDIVAECTSFDFILGNVVISLVFANLIFRGWMRRTLYVLSAVPVALAANILRTSSVVAITEWTGGRFDLGVDHRYYSLLVFSLAVLGHMRCGLAFRDVEDRPGRAIDAERLIAATSRRSAHGVSSTACVLALALASPLLAGTLGASTATGGAARLCPPVWLEPATPDAPARRAWQPVFEGERARLRGTVRGAGVPVDVFVAAYHEAPGGAKMIGAPNAVYDGKVWEYAARRTTDVGTLAVVETSLHTDGGERRVVWQWYRVGGREVANPLAAKMLEAAAVLGLTSRDSTVIAISAPLDAAGAVPRAALAAIVARRNELPVAGDGGCAH